MRSLVLVAAGVTLAAACVSTGATVLNPSAQHASICPEGVQLFTGTDKVGKEFHEVAVLTSKGDGDWTSEQGMANSQRKKAAELGANGVILGEQKDPSTGSKVWKALLGTSANRKGRSTAIYIPGDSTRVQQACAGKVASQ
jgi:hypothetical protein